MEGAGTTQLQVGTNALMHLGSPGSAGASTDLYDLEQIYNAAIRHLVGSDTNTVRHAGLSLVKVGGTGRTLLTAPNNPNLCPNPNPYVKYHKQGLVRQSPPAEKMQKRTHQSCEGLLHDLFDADYEDISCHMPHALSTALTMTPAANKADVSRGVQEQVTESSAPIASIYVPPAGDAHTASAIPAHTTAATSAHIAATMPLCTEAPAHIAGQPSSHVLQQQPPQMDYGECTGATKTLPSIL